MTMALRGLVRLSSPRFYDVIAQIMPGNKSTALQNLVKKLKSEGVPIDGVGIQCHLTTGQVPTTLLENFQAFGRLGVEFAVTELDMAITTNVTAETLEQQKRDYETVVNACNSVSACVGVTVWDFTDKYGWITNGFADIWDDVSFPFPARPDKL